MLSSWARPWTTKLASSSDTFDHEAFRILVQSSIHFATTAAEDALQMWNDIGSPFDDLLPMDLASVRDFEYVSLPSIGSRFVLIGVQIGIHHFHCLVGTRPSPRCVWIHSQGPPH
jgi:hypothetical protein